MCGPFKTRVSDQRGLFVSILEKVHIIGKVHCVDFDTRIFTIGVNFFVCKLRDESPTCGLSYMRVCDQSGLFVVISERVQTMVICMHVELGKSSVWTFCLYRIGKGPPYGLKCAHIYHQNGHFV